MKLLVKQTGHMLVVAHNATLQGAFLWWLTGKNRHCHSFCPTCKWYFRCQEDVAFEKYIEKER